MFEPMNAPRYEPVHEPWSPLAREPFPAASAETRQEIAKGLLSTPAKISPKYFYDERGSRLFERITALPEYYPTRVERGILAASAEAIAAAVGPGSTLIELGAGSCEKAERLCEWLAPRCFVGVDISGDYLEGAVDRLAAHFPGMDAHAVAADFTQGVRLPAGVPAEGRLLFYPGSSIGNFDPPHALALLAQMRALAGEGGGLLIGFDLPKDKAVLEAAYDDAQGVTAQFNLNALVHLNRLIGSNFDTRHWRHRAFFNAQRSRIEMHLEACMPQTVRWRGGQRVFGAGERIHTENSYKYPLDAFRTMLAEAGFSRAQAWTDPRHWFAVVHARP